MPHITLIAGARPNFMKIAPIIGQIEAQARGRLSYSLVHTGQHYDQKMSGDFFTQLGIPAPTANLEAGGGSQAEQTAAIMVRFEKYLTANPTDLVLVVGDVTSTMACAIVAKKLNTPVAHVEAGIRSFDMSMPEEINRIVTDSLTDYFFTTSEVANQNLRKVGVEENKIFFVGNVMIDTLLAHKPRFYAPSLWQQWALEEKNYLLLTLHRPANVDRPEKLAALLNLVQANAQGLPIVFPIHPRTQKVLADMEYPLGNIRLCPPLPYLEFNYLVERARAVVTDSGGITEETTVMGVPCLTVRDNTERPETITEGTNFLVGADGARLAECMAQILGGQWKKGQVPPLWDGHAAQRIVEKLLELLIK